MTAVEEYYKLKKQLILTEEEEKFFNQFSKKINVDTKKLTKTEYEILFRISKGQKKSKICLECSISHANFYVRVSRIFKKIFKGEKEDISIKAIDFIYEKAPEIISTGSYHV